MTSKTIDKNQAPRQLGDLLDADFMTRLDALDVLSRRILHGKLQGERRSKRRGQSVEFADHRRYVIGDDLRFVDWNIFGRLDQLFLKLFLEEQDLTVHIVMDMSESMAQGEPAKSIFVKKLAAALGYVSLVNNNRVTLSTFGEGLRAQLTNIRGRNYLPQMAEFLLDAPCEGVSDFDKASREVALGHAGSGILLILSDFLFKQGYEAPLRRLMGRQYDLYMIQILSPQEVAPELSGDLKLVDVEDGDAAEITVSAALLKFYERNLKGYCNELKDFGQRRGASYVLVKSSDSVEKLVLNYLQRIRLLG